MPRQSHPFTTALALAALMLALVCGCQRCSSNPTAETGPEDKVVSHLSQVPFDAQSIVAIDLARLRNQALWKVLLATLARDPHQSLAHFVAGAGFDPTQQVNRILLAIPGERQGDDRFSVIAEMNQVDEGRASSWVRRQLSHASAVFARDHRRFFIASGAWADLISDLAQASKLTPSAADNLELQRLCARVGQDHIFWFAAIVPASLRHSLKNDLRFPDTASITRVAGFVDLEAGLHAEVTAELSNKDDAIHLAHRLSAYLNQAKHHPDMLVHGFAPYLEAMRLKSSDASVQMRLDLTITQLSELASRIEALAHVAWKK